MEEIINKLKQEEIGVIPTDTLYGLVGSALSKKAVERIYQIKNRDLNKPFIILISDISDLNLFEINLDQKTKDYLTKVWPGPFSVVLPCNNEKLNYLHRGTNSLAFRIPDNEKLLDLLKQTGPLVAPSANFQDFPPAENIEEAQKYFEEGVDFYLDGGKLSGNPSTVFKIEDQKIIILRQGTKIPPDF